MSIIEKEILRREQLIAEKTDKQAMVAELKLEIERLTREIDSTDEVALRAEITELETYLPKTDDEELPVMDTPGIFVP